MHYANFDFANIVFHTEHLSDKEFRVLFRLSALYMKMESPIKDDLPAIRRRVKLPNNEKVLPALLDEFFYLKGGYWHSIGMDEKIAEYHRSSEKARISANMRWGKGAELGYEIKSDEASNLIEQSRNGKKPYKSMAISMQPHCDRYANHEIMNNEISNKEIHTDSEGQIPVDLPTSSKIDTVDLPISSIFTPAQYAPEAGYTPPPEQYSPPEYSAGVQDMHPPPSEDVYISPPHNSEVTSNTLVDQPKSKSTSLARNKASIGTPTGVDPATYTDYLTVRGKSPFTNTALKMLQNQVDKTEPRITLEAVFQLMVSKGWKGFKAGWEKDSTYTSNVVKQSECKGLL